MALLAIQVRLDKTLFSVQLLLLVVVLAVEIMAMAVLAVLEVELAIVQAVVLEHQTKATQAVGVVLITMVVQEVVLAQLAETMQIESEA